MIPARRLTPREYLQEFPPVGRPPFPVCNIINDVPLLAQSFLVYKHAILKQYGGDGTFPIPQYEEFQYHQELKSLEAVMKETDPGNSVFSHMFVSPADVRKIFGEDFTKKLEVIQKLVSVIFNMRLTPRSLARGSSRSHSKSILA